MHQDPLSTEWILSIASLNPHQNYIVRNTKIWQNRVFRKVPQRGMKLWVWSFFEILVIKCLLAHHVLEPVLKVGWPFLDLFFPSLNFERIFKIWNKVCAWEPVKGLKSCGWDVGWKHMRLARSSLSGLNYPKMGPSSSNLLFLLKKKKSLWMYWSVHISRDILTSRSLQEQIMLAIL